VLAIVADRAEDAATVTQAFDAYARREARGEVRAYLDAAAPAIALDAISSFDAAPDRAAALAAARDLVAQRAPGALSAFPSPSQRYQIAPAPTPDMEALRRYLDGTTALADGRMLYGAVNVRRINDAPVIEYWSTNLSHGEPSDIARGAMRLEMQREALAAQGLAPSEADRIDSFDPRVAQFDPRAAASGAAITLRDRAPFYAALALAFILWSVVFSVANMLLSGVIEEKSNKILDTLLTSVSPLQILTGKLLGVAMVSLTLFIFWGALGGGLLSLAAERSGDSILGQIAAAFLEPRLIAAFLIGFVAGYLMYGAIFLSLGSLCESLQEAQTLLGPVALVLAVPMLLITPALDNPNAPLIEGASWVPIFTPFLLLVRAPSGLDWIEIAGMGALMIVSVGLILMLAARIFRAGIVDQVSMSSWRGRKAKS
jgi:ABC-2 type transport system permease protein